VGIQGKQRGEWEYRGEIEESENTGETEGRVRIQEKQRGE
jgi:hypothetical protein